MSPESRVRSRESGVASLELGVIGGNLKPVKIQRFEEIKGWQHARDLSRTIYKLIRGEEFARDYGLKDQITRAAGSAMHNVAEGFDAESDADFVRFLRYAARSCSEVQSQLYIALDQGYIDQAQFDGAYLEATNTRKTLRGFIKYLNPDRGSN